MEGPIIAKDLVWAMTVLTRGTKRTCKPIACRCEVADKVELI